MAKYKLIQNGVVDTETGAHIPNAPGNRHWAEYLEWAQTNTADPEKSGAEKKAEKKAWINSSREEKVIEPLVTINLPVASPGTHSWQVNGGSTKENEGIRNINGMVTILAAGITLPEGFTYRDADNNDVPMTATDMISLGGQLMSRTNDLYKESWMMKAAVDAIADDDVDIDTKLAAIDWS